MNPLLIMAIISAAGGIAQMMKGQSNPADKSVATLDKIPGQIEQNFSPYIQTGEAAGSQLFPAYSNLVSDPASFLKNLGSTYQQSPGYQFQVDQSLGAANRAAAAGGMLGSPQEQQNIASTVNQLANQDYYNYLDQGMNTYGTGLQGLQGMYNTGFSATQNMSDDWAQALMSMANMQYAGKTAQQDAQGAGLGGLLSGIGGIFGSFGGGK